MLKSIKKLSQWAADALMSDKAIDAQREELRVEIDALVADKKDPAAEMARDQQLERIAAVRKKRSGHFAHFGITGIH